jgi:hypothetical protein
LVFRVQAADVDVTDPELDADRPFPRNPHHDHPWIVLARAVTDEDFVRDCQMTELAPEYPHVNWEALAYHVIGLLEPKNPLVDEEAADPPRRHGLADGARTDPAGALRDTDRGESLGARVPAHFRDHGSLAASRRRGRCQGPNSHRQNQPYWCACGLESRFGTERL